MSPTMEIVSATSCSRGHFMELYPLAESLKRIGFAGFYDGIKFDNKDSLANVYNERIEKSGADILIFVHDDVFIEDVFFKEQVEEGLGHFSVLGIIGNRRIMPYQATWHHHKQGENVVEDSTFWSGSYGQGACPFFSHITRYGDSKKECELLDGVFLAAYKQDLLDHNIRFDTDPRFSFHMYDVIFSIKVRQVGLTLGTWPISTTHRTVKYYDSVWAQAANDYIEEYWGLENPKEEKNILTFKRLSLKRVRDAYTIKQEGE